MFTLQSEQEADSDAKAPDILMALQDSLSKKTNMKPAIAVVQVGSQDNSTLLPRSISLRLIGYIVITIKPPRALKLT